MGAQWHYMLPVRPLRGQWQRPDLRNHRKLLIIDGKVGFTGSQNFIDSSYNKKGNIRRGLHWKDLMVRFDGPIVAGLNALFVTDWYSETGELLLREAPRTLPPSGVDHIDTQVVPSGPGFDGVHCYAPDGTLIGQIHLPEGCSNLCFGGPKRNRLFMTASSSLYAIELNTQGAAPG